MAINTLPFHPFILISRYVKLCLKTGVEKPSESVQEQVFGIFDKDNNGSVDLLELICGTRSLQTNSLLFSFTSGFSVLM